MNPNLPANEILRAELRAEIDKRSGETMK